MATVTLKFSGEVDLDSGVPKAVRGACESGASIIIVDLSDATFIDSTVLGGLVGGNRRLGEGAIRVVYGRYPMVVRIFELTGLTKLFPPYATVEAAMMAQ